MTFRPTDEAEVSKIITTSTNAPAIQDCFSKWLTKENFYSSFYILAPAIVHIVNKSLGEGSFLSKLKHADTTPLLKKENLDKEILEN